jgi:hypothetical protein
MLFSPMIMPVSEQPLLTLTKSQRYLEHIAIGQPFRDLVTPSKRTAVKSSPENQSNVRARS